MVPEDLAIWNRARAIVNDEIEATEIVRNSFFPTACRWLTFIETWAGGAIVDPSVSPRDLFEE